MVPGISVAEGGTTASTGARETFTHVRVMAAVNTRGNARARGASVAMAARLVAAIE